MDNVKGSFRDLWRYCLLVDKSLIKIMDFRILAMVERFPKFMLPNFPLVRRFKFFKCS